MNNIEQIPSKSNTPPAQQTLNGFILHNNPRLHAICILIDLSPLSAVSLLRICEGLGIRDICDMVGLGLIDWVGGDWLTYTWQGAAAVSAEIVYDPARGRFIVQVPWA